MASPIHYENVDTIIDGLSRCFDSKNLISFMKGIGSISDHSRQGNVVIFLDFLNRRETREEQQNLIAQFDNLLLSDYLKKKNKIVGVTYLGLKKGAFSEQLTTLTHEYLNDKNEFLKIFDADIHVQNFTEVYHKVTSSNDSLEFFEIIYARSYFKKDDDAHRRVEFIKVDFNFETGQVLFYLPYPVVAIGDIPHTSYGLFSELRKKIEQDFKVQLSNSDTDKQAFDIYKKYTESNEKTYVDKVNDADAGDVGTFYQQMVERLDPSLLRTLDRQPYVNRIKRIFVRLMVDNNFDDFVQHIKNGEGYITGFIYNDNMGSSITGKNGTGQSLDDQEINPLQASETYLDTRDTIYSDAKLFSVRIHFQPKKLVLPFLYDVRISALGDLLVIHFIRNYVTEERKDYVFQQLESLI